MIFIIIIMHACEREYEYEYEYERELDSRIEEDLGKSIEWAMLSVDDNGGNGRCCLWTTMEMIMEWKEKWEKLCK